MIDRGYISGRLEKLGLDAGVLVNYEETHRFYHTLDHIITVLTLLDRQGVMSDELFLAAVYHDIIYNPRTQDNEEKSAALFAKEATSSQLTKDQVKRVQQLILHTKDHHVTDAEAGKLMAADLNILEQPFESLVRYEHQIFKEYQYVDYRSYVVARVKMLEGLNKGGQLNQLIAYVKQRRPLIGAFVGSFNPFHRGHYNVLQKAERIFDKVIVAFGKNPEKQIRDWGVPQTIMNRQIAHYDGLLTDFVTSLGHEVVVIRGLRNSTDFQYEQNQYRYIQELMPDIRIVNIFCDKEFEHISSSGIRTLEKYDKHRNYLLD